MENPLEARRAGLARDAARRRLRRVTQVSVAVMVALGGTFAALAAGSTHAKKTIARAPVRPASAVVAQAPAPPLVGAQSSAPAASAAPAPPAAAPTASSEQPVAVSGGS